MDTLDVYKEVPPRATDTAGASKYIGESESFLEKARIGGTDRPGPKFRKAGRRVIYTFDDLDAYLDSLPAYEHAGKNVKRLSSIPNSIQGQE